jgi:S-adenosylmethionine:tRNA ribosyltransferase-isomerase
MDAARFDYPLPPERIAQQPARRRDEARLMVIDRATRSVRHAVFRELPGLLPAGARLFRNNASVLPARLRGHRPTGGEVECFLLHPDGAGEQWRCLVRPGRKLPVGATFARAGQFQAEVLERPEDGPALVHFTVEGAPSVVDLARRVGEVPLPPYIHRDDPSQSELDRERYQTVYADPGLPVAAAAPTAGLHFTPEVLADLEARGIPAHDITLHVGLDTFQPIQEDRVEDHTIHTELYTVPTATRRALTGSGPRLAVGTTTLRALEDYARKDGPSAATGAFTDRASLFIYPPATFALTDSLLTNFHLPRSTLLCLVSAFLTPGSEEGIGWLKALYADAVEREYRFYSYGDAMLIL